MSMIVQNKGDKGNPYHDEEGKFTTADDVTDGEHTIRTSNPLKISKKIDGQSPREKTELEKYYQNFKNRKNVKPVTEMSQEELLKENKEIQSYLESKGVSFAENPFGDIKLKCSNLRKMKYLMDSYDIGEIGTDPRFGENGKLYFITCGGENTGGEAGMVSSEANFFRGKLKITNFNTSIALNPKFHNSLQGCISVNTRQIKMGHSVDADEEHLSNKILSHEFGHLVSGKIFSDYLPTEIDLPEDLRFPMVRFLSRNELSEKHSAFVTKVCCNYGEKIIKEIYQEFQEDNPGVSYQRFKYSINSVYGNSSSVEWLAEAFCSLECGKPVPAALAFGKWLKKKGYKKGE